MYSLYDEGRILYDKGLTISSVEVNMKDHLGNVRAVFDITTGQVKQTNTYYPFGMQNSSLSANTTTTTNVNKYKYNGKMFQDENGLNWYDYGARFYDAVVGRWWSVDPLSEVSRRWSPYSYCYDNPMRFIDPDGMFAKVKITGDEADEATAQLQASTENLKLTRNSDGVISAEGEAKTDDEKKLLEAIRDPTITVNIDATSETKTKDGNNYFGGAFLGNRVNEGTEMVTVNNKPFEQAELPGVTTVDAFQQVNPGELAQLDSYEGRAGAGMLHETTVAYEGAKISQSKGINANKATVGSYNPIFNSAHNSATKQPAANNIFREDFKGGYILYLGTQNRKDVILKTIVQ